MNHFPTYTMWVNECKESLIEHMDIMLLPSPDESNPTSSATPADGTCMGTFDSLMDLETIGDCSTSVAETELLKKSESAIFTPLDVI